MNKRLRKLFVARLAAGLNRQAITSCSEWAMQYRMMGQPFPGPYSYVHHPWCKEMTDTKAETCVGMKAAQVGYTEVVLNKAFYTIDILGMNVLYVLPAATPDATDFSSSRFDPALDMSPHLKNMFSDVKNVGHKRAGNANLFIRGSRSRSQMKSLPAPLLIFDELDEMNSDNVILALERSSGQNIMQRYMISTPRIENKGIDVWWKKSSQEHYFFKCPHCSRLTQLVYPECLVITAEDPLDPGIEDSHLICKECKHVLDNDDKINWLSLDNCMWVPEKANTTIRGFRVSQLYSMAKAARPAVIAAAALTINQNPTNEQEFWNSKMGMCHTVKDARVTDTDLKNCRGDYSMLSGTQHKSWKVMGVDVGPKFLHVEISEYTFNGRKFADIHNCMNCKVLWADKVEQFEELDRLMKIYRIVGAVVDAQPEKRKAMEFAQRFYGRVHICYYVDTITSKNVADQPERDDFAIMAGRTIWLDTSLVRFKNKSIRLPLDIPFEYKEQIKVPVRSYERDKTGNPIGRYLSGDQADHYAHARNYAEIAIALAVSRSKNQDIGSLPI